MKLLGCVTFEILMDKIALNLWLFCRVIFICSALAIIFAPLDIAIILLYFSVSFVLLFVTGIGFKATQADSLYSVIYGTIATYLWFAYPFKVAVLAYMAEISWITEMSFLPVASATDFANAYFLCSPALILLLLGLSFPIAKSGAAVHVQTKIGVETAILIVALLLFKVFLQVFFDMAKPGVKPQEFSIPFMSGLLAFLTGFYLLALVNIYLYHALIEKNKLKVRMGSVFFLLLILSDLWVGYKQALILQVVIFTYYFALAKQSMPVHKRRKLSLVLVISAFIALTLYQYINDYRYALLSGQDVSAAVTSAVTISKSSETEGTLLSFMNRINGVDNFFASSQMNVYYSFSWSAMLDQSLGEGFNNVLYDGEQVNTQFGLTQFGAMYVIGGVPFMMFGSLVLGVIIRLIAKVLLNSVFARTSWAIAFVPPLSLWFVKVLFAGGVLLLYLKEVFLVSLLLYLTYKLNLKFNGYNKFIVR